METQEKVVKEKPKAKVEPMHMALIAILVVIVVVAAYFALGPSAQVVAAGDTINVTYTGSFTNGTVFGSNVGGQPLQFTVGANQLIPGFDQAVVGMRVGENKTVTVPVNEAYGPEDPQLIVSVPSNSFGNQTAVIGGGVSTEANGQEMQGVITAVNVTNVTVNFNPPLAGKVLVFDIKVISIVKG